MRITQEADYALRICAMLTMAEYPVASSVLSKELCVSPKFTSKILRELLLAGLVNSSRGINGGFTLAKSPQRITLRTVIEAIDGPIAVRHCLTDEHNCNYQKDKSKCRFHAVFQELNGIIISRLDLLTLKDMTDAEISVSDLAESLYKF